MAGALNRATSAYVVVFVIFIVGIWVILDLGTAFLTAPRDLSGTWRLTGQPGTADAPPPAFNIAQSGRFLRFTFDRGSVADLVMSKVTDGNRVVLTFAGQGWTVTGTGSPVSDSMAFDFHAPAELAPPPAGTYQRQRMGGDTAPSPTAHKPESAPPQSNATH